MTWNFEGGSVKTHLKMILTYGHSNLLPFNSSVLSKLYYYFFLFSAVSSYYKRKLHNVDYPNLK